MIPKLCLGAQSTQGQKGAQSAAPTIVTRGPREKLVAEEWRVWCGVGGGGGGGGGGQRAEGTWGGDGGGGGGGGVGVTHFTEPNYTCSTRPVGRTVPC